MEVTTSMFLSAKFFNQPLEKWDVSKVKDMRFMFFNACSFYQSLASWNVGQANDFGFMFQGSAYFEDRAQK